LSVDNRGKFADTTIADSRFLALDHRLEVIGKATAKTAFQSGPDAAAKGLGLFPAACAFA
jgi:hypothetical protein